MPWLGTLDRYVAKQTISAFAAVLTIVMSLMTLEHLPRLIELTRFSGNRGYVVMESLAGLLPEYGGIGLLVGLYLAVALLVRKLALRGELDAIEASGIGPRRWMRLPIVMSFVVAVVTFANQGWWMPDAERRLDDVGRRMAAGEFGHSLAAGQFIDLGKGSVLRFYAVAPDGRSIEGIFLRTGSRTFTARKGRLLLQSDGSVLVDLRDGQSIEPDDHSAGSFTRLKYASDQDQNNGSEDRTGVAQTKFLNIERLLAAESVRNRSAIYGRLLWVLLVPVAASLAFVLGKPPKRSASASGMFFGIVLLITCLKMLSPLDTGVARQPASFAIGIAMSWLVAVFALFRAEHLSGRGFLDSWFDHAFSKIRIFLGRLRSGYDAKFGKNVEMIVDR